jgi:hypothetical protein
MKLEITIMIRSKIQVRSVYTSVRMLDKFSRSTSLYHFVPRLEV